MSLTEYVADFAHGLEHEGIPQSIREKAIEHILDGYGLALSGHAEEGHHIMRRYAERVSCTGEMRVLGTSIRSSAEVAALVNGLAMHAMDYDDTQLSTNRDSVYGLLTHPTTPLLGAASAAAELVGASGRDLLTAYVAGVEVACRTADASNPRHYNSGFHSTGTFGAIGAAVAAGRLVDLTREQIRHALGIAEFRDEVVQSTEVREMMKRCRHVVDPEIEARGFQHLDTRITIRLKDGQVLEKVESAATGHPRKPMSREQLEAKFFECAELAISVEQARRAADMIWNLEKLEGVGELHRILSG